MKELIEREDIYIYVCVYKVGEIERTRFYGEKREMNQGIIVGQRYVWEDSNIHHDKALHGCRKRFPLQPFCAA